MRLKKEIPRFARHRLRNPTESLRGAKRRSDRPVIARSEATKQSLKLKEIATLPSVVRNDREIATLPSVVRDDNVKP
jgi:hypothetical protein